MILILTEAEDPHVDHVAQKLLKRGADFVRVNPAQFPTQTSVSLSYGAAGQFQGTLLIGNQIIDLHLLDARRDQSYLPRSRMHTLPARRMEFTGLLVRTGASRRAAESADEGFTT